MIQITSQYQKSELIWEFNQTSILIGRHDPSSNPDLDLFPDVTVSRRHARLSVEEGALWLEDIGSKYGIRMNGRKIRERVCIPPGARIQIGATFLTAMLRDDQVDAGMTITLPTEEPEPAPEPKPEPKPKLAPRFEPKPKPKPERKPEPKPEPEPEPEPAPVPEPEPCPALDPNLSIEQELDIINTGTVMLNTATTEHLQHLEVLFNLPLLLAAQTSLDELLEMIVQQMIKIIPGGANSTLLLLDPLTNQLILKAYAPINCHSVSTTLARRAMHEGCGFIWRRSEGSLSNTMRQMEAQTGMYVPLSSSGVAIGVLAVDSPVSGTAFSEESLRLMVAVSNYASMAVTNYQLKRDLQDNTRLLETLLSSFSPKIREILLERAKRGHLIPGGVKSEVTILFADMRGFTKKCAKMDAADVSEMLNDYFADLVDVIFQFDGTIDKFIGDAVLAVFGSPEPDPQQHTNAVRSALAMQEAMKLVSDRRAARRRETLDIGIGIHCGVVLHGFIGATDRLEFTVIGDVVNHTSRICDGAKAGEVLISNDVFRRVFNTVKTERVTITTKHQETFEVHRVKTLFETY